MSQYYIVPVTNIPSSARHRTDMIHANLFTFYLNPWNLCKNNQKTAKHASYHLIDGFSKTVNSSKMHIDISCHMKQHDKNIFAQTTVQKAELYIEYSF